MIDTSILSKQKCSFAGIYNGHEVTDIIPYEFDREMVSVYCSDPDYAQAYGFTKFQENVWHKMIPVQNISFLHAVINDTDGITQRVPVSVKEMQEIYSAQN